MSAGSTALIGICGVAFGALAQFYFGQISERRKHFRELRSQAYVAFVSAVAAITHAQRAGDSPKERCALEALTDAKVRIAVYGAKGVVRSLARFSLGNESLASQSGAQAFLVILHAMRRDSA